MLPDFEMVIHKFPDGKDITIIPIADVHLGAKECMEQEFIKFIDSIKDKPNVYLVLGGDLLNNATRFSLSNVFEETMRPKEAKKMMTEILRPVASKVLVGVGGNHERRNKDVDDDPMYDIMAKLDIEDRYRENIAFLKCQFGTDYKANGVRTSGDERPSYVLAVTHGNGGGMMTSGAVLRGERMGYALDGVDALVFGHTHKIFTSVHGKLSVDPRNNKVSVKPFTVINMTSWLEYSAYAMQKMLLPTTHSLHTITLCGGHKEMTITM